MTGLGLGCVVRGLLYNERVTHIDVVELDSGILDAVGPEWRHDSRVSLHHGNALTYRFPRSARWDLAWHDVWEEGDERSNGTVKLCRTHARLIHRYQSKAARQGAWHFPRLAYRVFRRQGLELL